MPERANPGAAPGDEMTLRLQLLHHVRRQDDDVGRLAGPNQPGRLHAAHATGCDRLPGPLLVASREIGQDLPRRHRRDACDLAGHSRLHAAAPAAKPQSTYFSPALARGSRIWYRSRPSTPEASLSRLPPSFASRAAAASAVFCAQVGRHDDDAVVVGDDRVARIDGGAGAHDRNVHRADRRLDRALGETHLLQTGKPISVSVFTSRTPASMTSARAPRALKLVARRSPK